MEIREEKARVEEEKRMKKQRRDEEEQEKRMREEEEKQERIREEAAREAERVQAIVDADTADQSDVSACSHCVDTQRVLSFHRRIKFVNLKKVLSKKYSLTS